MQIEELVRTKREEIVQLAHNYGASNVRFFGSLARGEAGPNSDVDLLVQMDEERSLLDLVGLWLDLEALLGRKVDILTDGGVSPYLRDRIYSEAVPI